MDDYLYDDDLIEITDEDEIDETEENESEVELSYNDSEEDITETEKMWQQVIAQMPDDDEDDVDFDDEEDDADDIDFEALARISNLGVSEDDNEEDFEDESLEADEPLEVNIIKDEAENTNDVDEDDEDGVDFTMFSPDNNTLNEDDLDVEEDEDTFESEPDEQEDVNLKTINDTEPKLGADTIEEFMNLDKSKYTIEHGNVLFTEISVKKSMNESRRDTKAGLIKSIAEVGILTPIHVMLTKEYDAYLRDTDKEKEDFKGYKYLLLDGYRRVFNGIKVGLDGCYATIWNFRDKDYGDTFAMVLSAILNKNQKHSMGETWDLIQKVRKTISISNRTLDSLFQLDNGDTNKLTEIMTSGYDDIIDQVMSGKKTIGQSYNALKKLWDEEDQGERDDKIGLSDYDTEHKVVDNPNTAVSEDDDEESIAQPQRLLSDDEVSEILGATDKYNDAELMDAYDDMLKEPPVKTQDTKNRKPIDKDIKAETLRRDNYQCVCCGAGEGLPLKYALSILQSHHKISVGNGGPDTKDNIVTVCPNCHTLIHTVLWNEGIFSKADFEALPEKEKARMRKVLKLAHADYQAAKKKGKTTKQIKEDNKHHSTFKMPGTDLHENEQALKEAGVDIKTEKVDDPIDTEKEIETISADQGID